MDQDISTNKKQAGRSSAGEHGYSLCDHYLDELCQSPGVRSLSVMANYETRMDQEVSRPQVTSVTLHQAMQGQIIELSGMLEVCRLANCYDFFPFPCLFPHLGSMMSLLLLCSFLQGDRPILTHLPWIFFFSLVSPLVSPCSAGLSHSLVTSLMVTVFPLPSIEFYDLPLR